MSQTPSKLRQDIAKGLFSSPTSGVCDGHIQANMVALPSAYAKDFEAFCQKNPKPCPLLEVIPMGKFHTSYLAQNANLLTDIPKYCIYENGQLKQEVQDIKAFYKEDLVFFLLGCSFSFESAMQRSGLPLRHIDEGKNVAMYDTNIALEGVGDLQGHMVVSMRPIHRSQVSDAVIISGHFPKTHGTPVHIGYPEMIGIQDLSKPDYGDGVAIKADEIPVFWACGVTPQNVLKASKLPFAITHSAGHMFVGDLKDEDLYEVIA